MNIAYTKKRTSYGDRSFDIVNITILSLIIVIVAYPLLFVVSASVSNPTEVLNGNMMLLPKGLNIEAYKRVFVNNDILRSYLNTIVYTVLGTSISLALTILAAYPLSRKDMKGRKFFVIFFTMTMFFSGGIVPTYLIVKNLGITNSILALILPKAISMYNVIIMRSYFEGNIPWEVQEAAIIDGSSNFGVLRKIIIPLSAPVIAVLVLFYGVANWNAYFDAMMYITKRQLFPLSLIVREILIQNTMSEMVQTATSSAQVLQGQSIKYAVIIVSTLPILALYPFIQKYFMKGIMVGAVKG